MAHARIDDLLATPLFADVDAKLLDGVRKEAAITDGTFAWTPGTAPRPGFVRFVEVEPGTAVIAQGDRTTELFVVLRGRVDAVAARARRSPYEHRGYGPGEWFGEVSAHSHHPALATFRATAPTLLAAIEARLFTKLYAEDDTFRARIDTGYIDQLGLHLRASPLCRDLDDDAIATLQRGAELRSVEENEVIAEAGAPADAVFLVRAGAVACEVGDGPKPRVLAFYKGNATFGEHAITSPGRTWPATFRALTRTALVVIPQRQWAQLGAPAQGELVRAANRLVGTDVVDAARHGSAQDLGSRSLLDELFVMVERESVKGGRALVINRTKCVRCNLCVESCTHVHDDAVPRLSKVGTPVVTDEVLVTACYHCEVPQCMLSCDYAAIRRDPQGRIRFEYDNCVGCAGCIDGCPYGVIRLVDPGTAPAPQPASFLASLPLIGRLFAGRGVPAGAPLPLDGAEKPRTAGAGGKLTAVAGKTLKCDLCAGLPFEACVYNCPTTAITRREPQSLFAPREARR
ncbi:MAG: cyclic nucleotide-binding domain-containing protein [Planctomycetes bacterium]|nr:cyclic nucleotide-binding domain-containing protein [Planctomycetota bacterium]